MGDDDNLSHRPDHNEKIQHTMNYLVAYLLLADLICVSAVTVGPRDTVLLTLTKGLFFTWLEKEKEKAKQQHSPADNDMVPPGTPEQGANSAVSDTAITAAAPTPLSRRWRGRCGGRSGRSHPANHTSL